MARAAADEEPYSHGVGRDPSVASAIRVLESWLESQVAYRGLPGHCHLYGALGVNTAEHHGPATSIPAGHGYKVEESVTVHRTAAELFAMWRRLDQLPRFMKNLKEVRTLDGNRSHWVAQGPLGAPAEWDAEIINERPNELIAWRSLPGSTVDTAGSVHFEPAAGGTQVRVVLKYDPPGGKLGAAAAWVLGAAPEEQLRSDLRRFKQLAEAEEEAGTDRFGRRL